MKWLRPKYTYALMTLSLLVSGGLQVVWLRQLFTAQQKQLKDDIEHFVSNTAQTNMYNSLLLFKEPGNIRQLKQLFLSPQWQQLRLAFDNMNMKGVNTATQMDINNDSTVVSLRLSLKDTAPKKKSGRPIPSNTGMTAAELEEIGRLSLVQMKKKVADGLRKIGISTAIYENIYGAGGENLLSSDVPKGLQPAYISRKYLYSEPDEHRYQLFLPSINTVAWYRMRYYLASSLLMILLTCVAFYYILRLLRNQRLYADAKSDFAANMTHELKTPIATVSLALESIQKYNLEDNPETLQNYLNISRHELHRLDLMVEKVLNINNGNDADQPIKMELYDVQSGLEQVIASMGVQLADGAAGIRFEPSSEPCFVFGDPEHLANIFYNLIDNAIKYAAGSLQLAISCRCEADNVVLQFKDNGPGIDKMYHQRIFERFFRVPAKGATHDTKGSGLGLYYVKQTVEKHGGSIKINSAPGSGTSFIITLPGAS